MGGISAMYNGSSPSASCGHVIEDRRKGGGPVPRHSELFRVRSARSLILGDRDSPPQPSYQPGHARLDTQNVWGIAAQIHFGSAESVGYYHRPARRRAARRAVRIVVSLRRLG